MKAARHHVGFDARRFTPKGAENVHGHKCVVRYNAHAVNELGNVYSKENDVDITPGQLLLAMFPESHYNN